MLHKYSKSYSDMWQLKQSLTDNDKEMASRDARYREIYKNQPERTVCKLCETKTEKQISFNVSGIEYWICGKCGHINGAYQDTREFCNAIYAKNSEYGETYRDISEDFFRRRVETVYIPKAEFLKQSLVEAGINVKEVSLLDIGGGAGHFVKACHEFGLKARGIEVDEKSVDISNKFLPGEGLKYVSPEKVCEEIENAREEVISFIFNLEHVPNLKEILEAVKKNGNIRYIFFAVPMFSCAAIFSAMTEGIFDRMFNGSVHTHMFSNESIDWLCNKYCWEKLGVWRFGADVADLLRIMIVSLENKGNSSLAKLLKKKMGPQIDQFQQIVDKAEFCSEIHAVVQKKQWGNLYE